MNEKEVKAEELFKNKFNCVQAVLGVFCEELGLDCKTALKISTGFGSGCRKGEVCGAVAGAVMAIGLARGYCEQNDAIQKAVCYCMTENFINKFISERESIVCRELLGYRKDEESLRIENIKDGVHWKACLGYVKSAVKIAEGLLNE